MKAIVLVLLVLASASALAENFKPEQLVGHWRTGEDQLIGDEVIRADGTSSTVIKLDGKIVFKCETKWWLQGDKRHYEYTASSLPKIPVGKKGVDTLLEVSRGQYVIQTSSGKREIYTRITGN